MEDITAVEDGKPAVEGEKRRKLLIGITILSILLGLIMMVMGCIMLSQYSVFLDFVTTRYTETAVFLLVIGLLTMAVSGTGDLHSDYFVLIYEEVGFKNSFLSHICLLLNSWAAREGGLKLVFHHSPLLQDSMLL